MGGIISEHKLKDFIRNIQDSVGGINEKKIGNNEKLISIFNEAAKNDNDGDDKVYSCTDNEYKKLVLEGIKHVKQIFGIKDEDIEAKLKEHCKKLDTMLDEYKEIYNKSKDKSSKDIFKMREGIYKEIEKIPYSHEDLYLHYIRQIRGEILEDDA